MSEEKKKEKLKISSKRIIIIFVVMFLIFEAIFYVSFQYKQFWPLETSFYIYTPCVAVLSIVFCWLSITQTYYEVDKGKIRHVKMGKVYEYKFSDIIFIDQPWSEKHKMLLFYQKDGRARYLAFDKNKVIYEYALNYSHLISEEEFIERFQKPNL